ncbi:heavy metal-binding domain-containing protein [Allofournierella sp.]|uniref:heavy metal-binding domain-containing protein n=1 Tax=Allofournierella sp. TaxID=1940256 RepID=UPI003AB4FA6C
MLIVTTESLPGRPYEALGMVKGNVVQSKNFGKDFMSAMKTLVGGEVVAYTEMLSEARQIAVGRMVKEAEALGADAIVCLRFASSSVMQGAAECIAYGTAVKFLQ